MELGYLLTRSGLTYPEVSPKVYHDFFCQLGSSISLPWVIYFEAFCLHVLFRFSCIPVIYPKLVLFLTPLQFMRLFCIFHTEIKYRQSHELLYNEKKLHFIFFAQRKPCVDVSCLSLSHTPTYARTHSHTLTYLLHSAESVLRS